MKIKIKGSFFLGNSKLSIFDENTSFSYVFTRILSARSFTASAYDKYFEIILIRQKIKLENIGHVHLEDMENLKNFKNFKRKFHPFVQIVKFQRRSMNRKFL